MRVLLATTVCIEILAAGGQGQVLDPIHPINPNELPANIDVGFAAPAGAGWPLASQLNRAIIAHLPDAQGWARLHLDGTLDSKFHLAHYSDISSSSSRRVDASDPGVLVAPNGSIYVCGRFSEIDGQLRARLARLRENGVIDPEFVPPIAYGASHVDIRMLAVQSNGKLLIAASSDRTRVHRLDSGGGLDPAYRSPDFNFMKATSQDPRDRLLVAGSLRQGESSSSFGLHRLLPDGQLDRSFGVAFGDHSLPVIQARDGIVVLGQFEGRWAVRRLHDDGSLDEAFGLRADAALSLLEGDYEMSVHQAETGELVVFGRTQVTTNHIYYRGKVLNPDGSLNRDLLPIRYEFRGDRTGGPSRSLLLGDRLLIPGEHGPVNGISCPPLLAILLERTPTNAIGVSLPAKTVDEISVQTGISEDQDQFAVRLHRLGESGLVVTVSFLTRDGSARAGEDFVGLEGTITFAPFETEKSLHLTIIDDSIVEPDEEFEIVLTTSDPQVVLNRPVRLRIMDDEPRLSLNLTPWKYGESARAHLRLGNKYIPENAWQGWRVEASEDLVHWEPLAQYGSAHFMDADGYWIPLAEWEWLDRPDVPDKARFYRAASPPILVGP